MKATVQSILCKEVEIAIMARKKEKADGVDNLPVELVQAGRESPWLIF